MTRDRTSIADLKRELELKDRRIAELKDEVDGLRDLVRRLEEQAQESDEYLENFVMAFGLVMNDAGKWTNSEALKEEREFHEQHADLVRRYNKLVGIHNRHIADIQPVGRPVAADEEEQEEILWRHKRGESARSIAEEMELSRRTVTTVINKSDGTDRSMNQRRQKLGVEPRHRDWRIAAREGMAKRTDADFEKSRELRREAKGSR
jgi:hypothetical protein